MSKLGSYVVVISHGEMENQIIVNDVESIRIEYGVYLFFGMNNRLTFSSPIDSTLYVIKE